MRLSPLLLVVCWVLLAIPLLCQADPPNDKPVAFPTAGELPSSEALPNPLQMLSGEKVASLEEWNTKRKPQLKQLFQHYMYGYLPAAPTKLQSKVTLTDDKFMDGKAVLSLAEIEIGSKEKPRTLQVLLVYPKSEKPVPMFVGMNFCGNHAVLEDARIPIPTSWIYKSCAGVENDHATAAGRGKQADAWNVDLILSRGYGLATFYSGDIDPDTADFSDGVASALQPLNNTPESAAGAIALWAWGYHRVVDLLVTNPAVDAKRIAAVGHSRNGKTTLLAAAMDERIALAIPHQAGCGGTAPSRGKVGESVKRINDVFPHWFCDNFPTFNDHPDRLPIDQNCLVALCAPRPVLFTNALDDQWANPTGQFRVLQAAESAYALHGVTGLGKDWQAETAEPPMEKLIGDRLGYFIRPGKHSMVRADWEVYLNFTDQHFRTK